MKNQLAYFYLSLRDFIDPLKKSLSDTDTLEFLFYRYGWVVPLDEINLDIKTHFSDLQANISRFLENAEVVQKALATRDATSSSSAIIDLTISATTVIKSIAAFNISNQATLPAPLNQQAFWEDVSEQLLDDLLETYLRIHHPVPYALCQFWGVIKYESIIAEAPHRTSYIRKTIDWAQGLAMIKNPLDALKREYHWGDFARDFDSDRFFAGIEKAFLSAGVLAQMGTSQTKVSFSETYQIDTEKDTLRVTLLQKISWMQSVFYKIGLSLLPVIQSGPRPNTGIMIEPILQGGAGQQFSFGNDFKMQWQTDVDLSNVFGVMLFPDNAKLVGGDTAFGASLKFHSTRLTPFYLLGNEQTSRVEISNIAAELSLAGAIDDVELKLQLKSTGDDTNAGCKILVLLDDADNFVKKTTSTSGFEFSFSPELIFSNKTGFSFNGNPNFNTFLPISKKLGSVVLQNPSIEFIEGEKKTSHPSIACRIGVGINGELGPLSFVVEQIGFTCNITPYSRKDIAALPPGADSPTLGNLDLDLKFAPPRGIGIEINAKVVTGGGYLYCDPERGEYIGVAQLNIKNKINLKAFGILLTKMPGGKPGYSFLLMISAEFPAIQLGLGFKLTGVGGLIGIQRRIELTKLTEGLRTNNFDDILFPEAPLENPYGLLNKLNAIFPPAEGQYVVGLMGQIAWGSKNLVTIELGLIVEFPEPVRLALIGVLKAMVKKEIGGEERIVLQLQVNFAGIFDFEKQFIRFDATLFESKLLGLKLEGDMALRIKYGASSDFALTVGGFHPDFQPPALDLPANIRRLQITLRPDNPSIIVSAYVAVTSNTFQFGAAGIFKFEKWGVKIHGELAFDALFQFSPFRFEVGLYFLLSASWRGYEFAAIEIDGLFSGPSPWHVAGSLRLKVWIFSKTVQLEETWGEADNSRLESVQVLLLLKEDLRLLSNWETRTGRTRGLVTLRKHKEAANNPEELFLHPNELVVVRQNTVPLGLKIDKFGARQPEGASKFNLKLNDSNSEELAAKSVKNHFAPAQFVNLSDEQKLQAPSYELFDSGMSFEGMDQVLFSTFMTDQPMVYEYNVIDNLSDDTTPTDIKTIAETPENFKFGLRNNAVANSVFGLQEKAAKPPVRALAEKYTIAWQSSLKTYEQIETDSAAEARQILRDLVQQNPQRKNELTVLLKAEAIN